jgi:hypothetical protein
MKLRVVPILLFLAAPGVAMADPPKNDPAAAQILFYDARNLMQAGKYAEACPKLEESLRLDPGLGTQFNLADCNEHIGKITTAWAGFLEVAAQSKATNQPEREKVARKRAAALEARLPKLVVDVVAAPPGLEVKRDAIVIGSAAWGTPIPVDPGTHRISATAPGKQPWEATVAASEGKTARISVPRDLPAAVVATTALPSGGPQPVASGATTTTTTTTSAPPPTTPPADFPAPIIENDGATQRTLGWIFAGLGVASVGVGAGFGLSSIGKRNESRSHCVVDACDAAGVELRNDAIRNGNVATVTTIAGGVAFAGGLILVLTAPKGREHERAGKVRAVPSFAASGAGLLVQGNFQ